MVLATQCYPWHNESKHANQYACTNRIFQTTRPRGRRKKQDLGFSAERTVKIVSDSNEPVKTEKQLGVCCSVCAA